MAGEWIPDGRGAPRYEADALGGDQVSDVWETRHWLYGKPAYSMAATFGVIELEGDYVVWADIETRRHGSDGEPVDEKSASGESGRYDSLESAEKAAEAEARRWASEGQDVREFPTP